MIATYTLGKRNYCGHCKEYISSATYRCHCEKLLRNMRVKLNKYNNDDTQRAASDSEVSCYYRLVKHDFSKLSCATLYSIEAPMLLPFVIS